VPNEVLTGAGVAGVKNVIERAVTMSQTELLVVDHFRAPTHVKETRLAEMSLRNSTRAAKLERNSTSRALVVCAARTRIL
jgi:hypothetical protein